MFLETLKKIKINNVKLTKYFHSGLDNCKATRAPAHLADMHLRVFNNWTVASFCSRINFYTFAGTA